MRAFSEAENGGLRPSLPLPSLIKKPRIRLYAAKPARIGRRDRPAVRNRSRAASSMAILADDDIDGMDTELAMSENRLFGSSGPATGVSHERFNCVASLLLGRHGHFAHSTRDLASRKYTQLLQHSRDNWISARFPKFLNKSWVKRRRGKATAGRAAGAGPLYRPNIWGKCPGRVPTIGYHWSLE